MKVSLCVAGATSTERHNDRSMYTEMESPSEFERMEHSENVHFDIFYCDSSKNAEIRFYEQHFRDVLDKQNAMNMKNGHPERVMTMDEYHAKHMPREAIVQLGNLKEQPNNDDYLLQAAQLLRNKAWDSGIDVISYDIHYDEATPHLHIRFIGIDHEGKPNLERCLRDHHVPTPLQELCNRDDIHIDYDQIPRDDRGRPNPSLNQDLATYLQGEAPELFYTKRVRNEETGDEHDEIKFKTKSDTRVNTFTNAIWRDGLEELARSMGYELDTVREHRRHMSIQEFKAEQQRNDLTHERDESVEQLQAGNIELQAEIDRLAHAKEQLEGRKTDLATAKAQHHQDQNRLDSDVERFGREVKTSYSEFKRRIEGALQSVGQDQPRDREGRIIDKNWIDENRRDLEKAEFRESKKDRVEKLLTELEKELSRPDHLDMDQLQELQNGYDRHQQEVKRIAAEKLKLEQEALKKAQEAVRASRGIGR